MKIIYENKALEAKMANYEGQNITKELEDHFNDFDCVLDMKVILKDNLDNGKYEYNKKQREAKIFVESVADLDVKRFTYNFLLATPEYIIYEMKNNKAWFYHASTFERASLRHTHALWFIKKIMGWDDLYNQILEQMPSKDPEADQTKQVIIEKLQYFLKDKKILKTIFRRCADWIPE